MNDIGNFAKCLKVFKSANLEFFNIECEESDSGKSQDDSELPLGPELAHNFFLLDLIDDFRFTGNVELLDKLMMECANQTDLTEESICDYPAIQFHPVKPPASFVIKEEDNESEDA